VVIITATVDMVLARHYDKKQTTGQGGRERKEYVTTLEIQQLEDQRIQMDSVFFSNHAEDGPNNISRDLVNVNASRRW
jgi:hypothetical protein